MSWNIDVSSLRSTIQPYKGSYSLDLQTATAAVTTNLDFTGSFTIEVFFYATSYAAITPAILHVSKAGVSLTDALLLFRGSGGATMNLSAYRGSVTTNISVTTSVGLNTWYHVAMCFNATTRTMYLAMNGTVVSTVLAGALTIGTGNKGINVMYRDDGSPNVARGYVDNIRVSQTCLYTTNYTVPDPTNWVTGGSTVFAESFESVVQSKLYSFNFNFNEIKPTYANIGIGTTNPIKTLDVNGDIRVVNSIYKNNRQLAYWTKTNNDIYYTKGNIGINTTATVKLDINGDLRSKTRLTNSDLRLKYDIEDEKLGLSNILKLTPKVFNYISNPVNNRIHGFIAQEVEETEYNDIIDKDSNGYYTINLESLITPLIKSIQDLSRENDILTSKVNYIENK